MSVYCNRSQKTSQFVKNNSHTTRLRLVSYFLFFSRSDVICDFVQYTRIDKTCIYTHTVLRIYYQCVVLF